METKFGIIEIELFEDIAPKHSANFKKLVKEGFYNKLLFHRVIPNFVIQGGDPKGDGTGGPGYTIEAEISDKVKHQRGTVAAARTGDAINPQRRSSGSQFYICVAPQPALDGKYTIFGKVIKGMDVVDKIANVARDRNDKPLEPIKMEQVYLKK
ncbi:MAG TPA: peptidylprolyl isomerase [bacterium]|nr:peptidylprolyl isomerase [bacterium]HOL48612.1 peptidylprolyl isomerase [bacterium]HPQ19046.1 peptidylprolyl isomerase [bacterium]